MTALVILSSGVNIPYGMDAGAELTISGFTSTFGPFASLFTAVALCSFAFSTILGWGLYGARFTEFVFRSATAVEVFLLLYALVSIVGATMNLSLIWSIAETFNGLMVIPNLIALFLLSPKVLQLIQRYEEEE